MSDQPRRPVFFWLVLLVCVVYAGLFAFTVYAVARYYGVEKAPGWSASDGRHGLVCSDVDDVGPGGWAHPARGPVAGDQWRRASPLVLGLFEWGFVRRRQDLPRRSRAPR